jgi:regulatory protein
MKRPPASLRSQALALLARREHSRLELRHKLMTHARKLAQAQAQAQQAGSRHGGETAPAGAPGDEPDSESAAPEPFDAEAWSAQVEAVLDGLGARGLQSDARFIESRVHARAARHGQSRIRLELARHGVELDADTARHLRDTEFSRAREVWLRKFGSPAADAAGRARQMRFLAARGFGAEVIRRVVGGRDED